MCHRCPSFDRKSFKNKKQTHQVPRTNLRGTIVPLTARNTQDTAFFLTLCAIREYICVYTCVCVYILHTNIHKTILLSVSPKTRCLGSIIGVAEESRTTEAVERDNNLYTMHRWLLRRSIIDRHSSRIIVPHRRFFSLPPCETQVSAIHVPDPEMPVFPKSQTFSTETGIRETGSTGDLRGGGQNFRRGPRHCQGLNRFELFRIFPCDGLFLLEFRR